MAGPPHLEAHAMTTDFSSVALIDDALDKNPYCRSCGAPTTVRVTGDRVYVECAAATEPRSTIGQLLF